ncbi:UNVERIFIED_ORG: ABC-type Fe3+/spermidine/putrescine transport system ATPase subunit [Variovorax paradoxus]|nr:ABC-type Fe3+/spermidine/putrescine transport system ATPase subunit [Variovorax paradoxus]
MSLLLDKVSYNYPGSTHGLHEVSLDVRTGELVAVIGPSGSGKSTLLKLVSGLETGHTGRIALDGEDMSRTPVHQRHIGMVFQSYALFPHLSVLDNVAYGLKLRKVATAERRQRAQELLDIVGLGEFSQRAVAQLSGGQQQRVALARALAIDPRALLLDEPLSALDASVRGHLRDQIRAIQQRFNATTLLVTHDQEEALAMADRVAMLKDGRLLQIATPRDIYENPARWRSSSGSRRSCPRRWPRRAGWTWALPNSSPTPAGAPSAPRCRCWCAPSTSAPTRRPTR